MSRISGTVLRLTDLSEADRGKWRALIDRAVDDNPFFDIDYVEPLATGLRTAAEVHLAVVEDAEGWLACMPVHPTDDWHRLRLPAAATWRGHILYGLLGTPLLAPGPTEAVLDAFLRALRSVRRRPAFLALDWLAADSPATLAFREFLAGSGAAGTLEFESFERAAIHRRAEESYVDDALSSKRRRELRRQWRKLGEELGEEPRMVDLSGEPSAPQELVDLEGRATKSEKGTMLAHDAGHTEFFLEMCRRLAPRERLKLFALRGGGQTIAMKCTLNTEDAIFELKVAYAPEWAAASPGIQLELQTLKFFHECSEAQMVDSCADSNNVTANRLYPDRRRIVSLVVPAPGAAGLAAGAALRAARAARSLRARR